MAPTIRHGHCVILAGLGQRPGAPHTRQGVRRAIRLAPYTENGARFRHFALMCLRVFSGCLQLYRNQLRHVEGRWRRCRASSPQADPPHHPAANASATAGVTLAGLSARRGTTFLSAVSESGSGPAWTMPSSLTKSSERGSMARRSNNACSSGRSPSPHRVAMEWNLRMVCIQMVRWAFWTLPNSGIRPPP